MTGPLDFAPGTPLALILPLAFSAFFAAPTAQAQQVVVTDVTYEHSATTTTDSHYRVDPSPETPDDLTTPIDYASGTAHVRLEVFTKPSAEATRFQICFEARPTYACTGQAPPYTATGVYTWATPFSSFYQGDMVDWTMGTGRIALILKDTMNGKPSPENVGTETSALFMPTMLRVTVTFVAPGGTYVDPTLVEDAGVAMTDAAVPDTGPPPMADSGEPPVADTGTGGTPPVTDSGPDAIVPDADTPVVDVASGCSATAGGQTSPLGALLAVGLLFAICRRPRSPRR